MLAPTRPLKNFIEADLPQYPGNDLADTRRNQPAQNKHHQTDDKFGKNSTVPCQTFWNA